MFPAFSLGLVLSFFSHVFLEGLEESQAFPGHLGLGFRG